MLDLRNISNLLRNISCLCMFLLFAPQFERDLYCKNPVYRQLNFVRLVKSLMKSVWSDETGRMIN